MLDGPSSYSWNGRSGYTDGGPRFQSADFEASAIAETSGTAGSSWATDVPLLSVPGLSDASTEMTPALSSSTVELSTVSGGAQTSSRQRGRARSDLLPPPVTPPGHPQQPRLLTDQRPLAQPDSRLVFCWARRPGSAGHSRRTGSTGLSRPGSAGGATSRRTCQGPLAQVDPAAEISLLRRKLAEAEKANTEIRRRLITVEGTKEDQDSEHRRATAALRKQLQLEHEATVAEELAAVRLLQSKLEDTPEHRAINRCVDRS